MKHTLIGALVTFSSSHLTAAYALPGQSLETMWQWTNDHAMLAGLRPVEKLEAGYPGYRITHNLASDDFAFDVFLNSNQTVYSEVVDYRTYRGGHQDLTFSPSNSYGLGLIRRIYGSTFVRAFQNAIPVAEISLAGTPTFYRGTDYAYQVWTAPQAHSFTFLPLQDLERIIAQWQVEADRWREENQVDPCLSVC